MINFFNQQLQSIYSSKKALAKDIAQRENKALLALHPKFEELLKTKKQIELNIVKTKSKGLDTADLQNSLDNINDARGSKFSRITVAEQDSQQIRRCECSSVGS